MPRGANAVTAALATDGLLHLYWATGATWPASDSRELSYAVLGTDVPFTPPVLLPLTALLWTAAALVHAGGVRAGRPGGGHPLLRLAVLLVATGLSVRTLAGLVWITGAGVEGGTGSAFYWLNLLCYTPLCAALALVTGALLRRGDPARAHG